jgi:plastocyanin
VIITISNFAFAPTSVTITAGTTVQWVNKDASTHTTTSDGGDPASWDSGPLMTNATFSVTFTTPGTYGYHCAIHPFMTATITVTS